ncbi:MAG: oxygen-dependent coproporphyrinogen oxidase [Rhizobacter sp.]|nr:oxygen-dependent coproporphyrinogen oxidase [Chlorobiales bacterium]
MKEKVQTYFEGLQSRITTALEVFDGKAKFIEDAWVRAEGGGGNTRIITNGDVFEKGGVAFSAVHGRLPEKMATKMNVAASNFFATGVSLVLHPQSPMIPTVHCNYRYFEQYDSDGTLTQQWFGGGADLTPYYPTLEDAQHFHRIHKTVCDRFDPTFYPKYKAQCDAYFYLPHRNETRGIGGIFFDYVRDAPGQTFEFVKACGDAFLDAYLPIAERHRGESYTEPEKNFQRVRRGRYVEFNLVYDRGTTFGLETNGRTESILMSLPPEAAWVYNFTPEAGSRESELSKFLKPHDWLELQGIV